MWFLLGLIIGSLSGYFVGILAEKDNQVSIKNLRSSIETEIEIMSDEMHKRFDELVKPKPKKTAVPLTHTEEGFVAK